MKNENALRRQVLKKGDLKIIGLINICFFSPKKEEKKRWKIIRFEMSTN